MDVQNLRASHKKMSRKRSLKKLKMKNIKMGKTNFSLNLNNLQ